MRDAIQNQSSDDRALMRGSRMRGCRDLARTLLVAACCLCVVPAAAQVVDANGGRNTGDPSTRRLSIQVVPGITSPRQLEDETLQRARTALAQGGPISFTHLRALADRRDGFAAYRLAEFLMSQDNPALAADAALYFSIAAGTGRGGAMGGMIKAIDLIDPETASPARLQVLLDMLLTYAQAGNSQAVTAALRYHLTGAPFGPLEEHVDMLVSAAGPSSSAPVALQMATAILQAERLTRGELQRARDFLMIAKDAETLSTALTATNLLSQVEVALIKAPRFTFMDFEVALQ